MGETRLRCCQQRNGNHEKEWNLSSKHMQFGNDDMCDISPMRMRYTQQIPKTMRIGWIYIYIVYLSHMKPHFHLGKSPPSQSTKVAAPNKRQITMIV
jgi:hypothetical protein